MLSIETLSDLEQRIDKLITAFQGANQVCEQLRKELEGKNDRIRELESEKQELEIQLDTLRGNLDERQEKLNQAAERVQDILKKFETVGA